MGTPADKLNRTRAAEVLVDAHFLGVVRAAAKWGVTDRTVQNYRARLANDVELARLFVERRTQAAREWHDERLRFLKSGLAKLDELVSKASKPSDITAVANAVKVVGELQVAEDVLGGHGADPARPISAAPEGDAAHEPAGGDEPERH